MQKFLSFNTVFQGVSIIIHENNKIIFEKNYDYSKQSEILVSSLEDSLKQKNLSYNDIDVFSSILGPGNFTGIKTSLAVLKMLKISIKRKIITNNIFEIISFNYKSDINILDLNNVKYYIEDRVNNKYFVIYKTEINNFIKKYNYIDKQILTNDKNLKINCEKNVILSDFTNEKWVNSIVQKGDKGIYDDKIEPLYIEEASISKRKN